MLCSLATNHSSTYKAARVSACHQRNVDLPPEPPAQSQRPLLPVGIVQVVINLQRNLISLTCRENIEKVMWRLFDIGNQTRVISWRPQQRAIKDVYFLKQWITTSLQMNIHQMYHQSRFLACNHNWVGVSKFLH